MARSTRAYLLAVALMSTVLVASLLLMLAQAKPAEAAFPGTNGKIAFTSNRNTPEHTNPEGDLEIFTMQPDGSDIEQLTDNGADDLWPAFSPDGKQITFLSTRDGNSEIYSMNADGSNQARLTHNATGENYPAFFPDGERIVFVTDRDGNSEIYSMNADGSDQTRLTHNAAYDADTSVSPEGKITFTSHRDGNFEVYTMNADGSNQTRLTHNAAYDGRDAQPNYSPDGKQIAFESTRNGNAEIYVMNADGSNQTRLTFNEGWLPSFSPDGKKITFFSSRDGNEEVYVMNTDGSNQTRLTNNPASDRATDWQPLLSPTAPQTKADCKKGGYKEFGFKKQGQCIAFVNRAAQNQPTRTYSAVGDFSATQNPSGAWSYGYRASARSGFVLYTNHANPWGPDFDQWSLNSTPTVTPHVTFNRTGEPASFSTITHPPDVLNLHPGPGGEKSVVRWTAPSSGTVKIEGRFEGIDTHGTTTDVAVVHTSATTLFSGNINGYGATAPFSITKSVAAGDTIDFSVGYGSNADHGFDSTGLSATITY